MQKTVYKSISDEETQKIGEDFAKKLSPGDTVFLYGNLGYGKTTFVKGVAKGLGITARVISPTFTIVRTHKNMHHVDLYRIEEKQMDQAGIQELLQDKNAITLIEWPEKLQSFPEKYWEVRFYLQDHYRDIQVINHGSK